MAGASELPGGDAAVSGGADGALGAAGGVEGGSGSSSDGGESACVLYPQQTEGPYYLDLDLLRSDITEGKPGTPLTVMIRVLRATDCTPLQDVAVDIWHCDAEGVYAGFPGQLGGLDTTGQRFLRGTQITDADGVVRFETVYPGWYPGRTTHIHFKVRPSSTSEATSQMYFPEETSAQIYRSGAYADRGQKDTSNDADGINRGEAPLATIVQTGARFEAHLRVTVST